MARDRSGAALRSIHALFAAGTVGGLTDGQLLERFATRDGESAELAFAALVERHGPMVLRVCRGVLRDGHDAEDAFQATFLILARKARSVWVRDSLGPWLHGVAYHVASTAQSTASRRRSREREAAEMRPRVVAEGDRDDLGAVVHEELNRLPGRYRSAVVLCCLEGLTQQQAAQRLGWPLGTVQSRLARGREQLRVRLTRRGLAPSAGLPVAILSIAAARAAVPAALASATIRAATRFAAGKMAVGVVTASVAALTDGVLKTMALTKLVTLGVSGLLLGVVLTGAGVLAQQTGGPQRAAETKPLPLLYELRIWKDGKLVVETVVGATSHGEAVRVETPDGPIEIRPASEREGRPGDGAGAHRTTASQPAPVDFSPKVDVVRARTVGSNDQSTIVYKQQLAIEQFALAKRERNALNQQEMKLKAKLESLKSDDKMPAGELKKEIAKTDARLAVIERSKTELGVELENLAKTLVGTGEQGGLKDSGTPAATDKPVTIEGRMNDMMRKIVGMPGKPVASDGRMGGGSMDQRMTDMERKLDLILRLLEASNAMKD